MTPMTWLMRKTWLGESRTCIALSKATKWHPQFTYRWWLFWMTKIHCEMTAICDQMSVGCEPNKSTDEESQRQFGLPKSQEKNWNKKLTCQSVMVCLLDPFTLPIFMHNKIQKLYPKVLEELKLGFDPLLAAKKSDLWFYLTDLLQQFIKTNKSYFNCTEQCSVVFTHFYGKTNEAKQFHLGENIQKRMTTYINHHF